MSAVSGVVTGRHFEYLARRTVGDDAFLLDLKKAASAAGIPAIWIAPEQASFLQILLMLARAREVVEVGTLAGYAAIRMARALPAGGRVRTFEISRKHAEFAHEWAGRSDVATRVEVILGNALEELPKIAASSVDAAFIDADKSSYPRYLKECERILKPGGLLTVDNAFAFGQLFDEPPTDREVPAVRAFNDLLAKSTTFQSVIVPLGDGCWVGVKRASA